MITHELPTQPYGDALMVSLDPAQASRDQLFRLLSGIVVPRPIAWTSTISPEGVLNLAPFSYYMVVSTVPPMLSLTIEATSTGRSKDTLSNIEATGEYVINSVSSRLAEKMYNTSLEHAPEIDEFAHCAVTPAPSIHVSPPRVAESKVSMECVLQSLVRPGSDMLVIGEVKAIHVSNDVLSPDESIDIERLKPLGRVDSRFIDVPAPFGLPRPPRDEGRT